MKYLEDLETKIIMQEQKKKNKEKTKNRRSEIQQIV